ncbi:STE/STE20/FRAY protein kinase [Thecamonas trahens ATCC 50062]|uniref:STE/STE20/FRAY protein kinase n=1 Tax=Thecamonas trahens ATCC 50062 TaxID=461836 RepID=A0A0L0D6U1_THETB|nr:STE/STE20/FRAY protein kinase [Thecamonas trahens ATCC 50062]KNC47930.1 STE/STE20/FRAY protein kinase [Thecamonas trahens ATCC 50062]|eukprot:XP_013758949.1 STE/STE20/FRAY protein kinase [Thecamonas trahens ATCC 50062]
MESEWAERRFYPCTAEAYELREVIGVAESGRSVVWRAWAASMKKEVAVKVVDLDTTQGRLIQVQAEVSNMGLAWHPNILPYYVSFVKDSSLWIVMRLARGSLRDVLNSAFPTGFAEEAIIASVLAPVVRALAYLHEHGRIHSWVNASNILVTHSGEVLLDAFSCIVATPPANTGFDLLAAAFAAGASPCWTAPEVLQQAAGYDARADIWSLGITAMELALGFPPYAQWPSIKIMYHVLHDEPPTLTALERERFGSSKRKFSKAFRSFVASCLVKDPAARAPLAKLAESKFFRLAKKPGYLIKKVLDHTVLVHDHDVATNEDTESLAAILKCRLRSKTGNEPASFWDFPDNITDSVDAPPPARPKRGRRGHARRRTKSKIRVRVRVRRSRSASTSRGHTSYSRSRADSLSSDFLDRVVNNECSLTTESTTSLDEDDDLTCVSSTTR